MGNIVYLPCVSGTVAVKVAANPPGLSRLWSAGVGGGPPIVAAGLVWTIGQNGTLYGLDPSTGAVRQQASIGVPANHFPTPSVGGGVLLAPAANRVVAFRTTDLSSTATTIAKAAKVHPARKSKHSGTGGVGFVVVGLVLLTGIGLLVRRRHRSRVFH